MTSRRDLLTGIGAAGAVGIAGCSDNGADDGVSTDRSSNETGNDPTAETSDGDSGSPTPVAVTRRFWEALTNEEYDAANELLHPGSLNYPLDESDISIPDTEVRSVEEVTYDEASERFALASEGDLTEAIQERTGVSEYALVYVEFSDGETVTPVVEDDAELRTVYLR